MPDSFFTSSKSRKRKRTESAEATGKSKNFARKSTTFQGSKKSSLTKANGIHSQKPRIDEELSDQTDEGDSDVDAMDLRAHIDDDPGASGEEDENETPAEKRLRLAQLYLDSVKVDLADGEFDAADIDKELISARLKQDVLEHSGKVHLFIADSFDFALPPSAVLRARGHRFSVTCAIASESGKCLFTSGKEGTIVKWDLSTGKKLTTKYKIRPPNSDKKGKGKATSELGVQGHTDEVLSLALSGDGKLLASAGRDKRVCVWDTETCEWVKAFSGHLGHRDVVSNVAFRKGTNQLYSGSLDRTVKVYDLSPSVMGYVETQFGHQDHVLGLDALRGENCVSVGGRDKTLRYWKIADETQIILRGGGRSRIREVLEGGLLGDDEGDDEDNRGLRAKGKAKEGRKFVEGSLECVAMIDETTFLSGGDSGSICLWSLRRKKPVFTEGVAHGFNEVISESEGIIQTPRWITALASLRYSNLFVSGSWDGDVRIWKLDSNLNSFSLVGKIPALGVVNSLQLLTPPKDFSKTIAWRSSQAAFSPTSQATKELEARSFLVVAGLGQEHRLGRWLKIKGAINEALVVVFSPRTLV